MVCFFMYGQKDYILGNIPAFNMLFLLLLNMYEQSQSICPCLWAYFCRTLKMYSFLVILYRQTDDFLIAKNNPVRIPKIILVIIKIFYNKDCY